MVEVIDCSRLDLDAYERFLAAKAEPRMEVVGRQVRVIPSRINVATAQHIATQEAHLFDYQRFVAGIAFERQRFAAFKDCGLGKTALALAWIDLVLPVVTGKILIIAPLAVIDQWRSEQARFYGKTTIHDVHDQDVQAWAADPSAPRVAITNHEKFHDPIDFHGAIHAVVLDESSILKNGNGATRTALIQSFPEVPFKLCLSATPAPNDREEYGNHATFLGYTRSNEEFLSMFFVNRDNGWELKPHGLESFYRYLAGWSIYLRSPAAYGFQDNLKDLPPVQFHVHSIKWTPWQEQMEPLAPPRRDPMRRRIFLNKLSKGFTDQHGRGPTHKTRKIVELCRGKPSIVWVEYNEEADIITQSLKAAKLRVGLIGGNTPEEERTQTVAELQAGRLDVIVSKPRILGFGLNLQFITNQVWSGLTDSYEQFYQAVKRSHRYGATQQIDVHLPLTESEAETYRNILTKKQTFEEDSDRQEAAFAQHHQGAVAGFFGKPYTPPNAQESTKASRIVRGDGYTLLRGDSIRRLRELPPESADVAVFSPPFAQLFTYSNDIADMGNCGDGQSEFALHYEFFLKGLYDVMKPGRIVCCHVSQLSANKARDGYAGTRDFRGEVIRLFQQAGFVYFSEWTIQKDPQMQAIKEKVRSLAFAQLDTDRLQSRPGFSDFILIMKKPGDAGLRLGNGDGPSRDEWIEWASGVWTGLSSSFTLNTASAKTEDDVKHICPMNLEAIDRCIRMYSGPGELVLDPFNGIGSTGVVSLARGRRYLGIELKPEYFLDAKKNLEAAQDAGLPPIDELRQAVSDRRKAAKRAEPPEHVRPLASFSDVVA
jgi:DNA modification methylase/superfamily II DNA or RNA helicase